MSYQTIVGARPAIGLLALLALLACAAGPNAALFISFDF